MIQKLSTIWLQKDEFNALMIETSDKVKKFTQIAASLTGDELKEAQKNLIWSSCKACTINLECLIKQSLSLK